MPFCPDTLFWGWSTLTLLLCLTTNLFLRDYFLQVFFFSFMSCLPSWFDCSLRTFLKFIFCLPLTCELMDYCMKWSIVWFHLVSIIPCSVCRFFRSCAWLYASDSPSLLEEGDTGICFQTMGMKGHDMLIMARWFYAYICWTHERWNLDRVLEIAWKLSAGDSGFSQPLGWWFGNCEWKLCEVGNKEKEWLQKETWRHTFLLAFQSLGIVYGRLRTAPL